jgi:hypothetical protein
MGKKKNREFVSAAGTAGDIFQKLAQAVYERGGNDDALRLIIADEDLRGRLADLIMETQQEGSARLSYRITVDWTRSLAEMIAAGRYDSSNSAITEGHFPLPSPENVSEQSRHPRRGAYRTPGEFTDDGAVEVEPVHLNRLMKTEEVLAELDRRGLRPATLPELLAFGEKHPDVQRKFPVVALGSVWAGPSGYRCVPCLSGYSGDRSLDLDWDEPGDEWGGNYRFLAVRK